MTQLALAHSTAPKVTTVCARRHTSPRLQYLRCLEACWAARQAAQNQLVSRRPLLRPWHFRPGQQVDFLIPTRSECYSRPKWRRHPHATAHATAVLGAAAQSVDLYSVVPTRRREGPRVLPRLNWQGSSHLALCRENASAPSARTRRHHCRRPQRAVAKKCRQRGASRKGCARPCPCERSAPAATSNPVASPSWTIGSPVRVPLRGPPIAFAPLFRDARPLHARSVTARRYAPPRSTSTCLCLWWTDRFGGPT
mmetsp:Transcript_751/g.1627  ORF Transcript_751/g.1627 Transcript_751/m.1627 type:complete len:253 (-) Transcript_751:184-942(-)